jgi:hypothetical protein
MTGIIRNILRKQFIDVLWSWQSFTQYAAKSVTMIISCTRHSGRQATMSSIAAQTYYGAFLAAVASQLLVSCASPPITQSSAATAAPLASISTAACEYDRDQLLALEMTQFDQNLEGGWRTLANQEGCLPVAADLIRDYHAARPEKSYLLYWHEGQVRALSGDYASATQLFEMSYNVPNDPLGWNLYVDATIAFMKQDRTALVKAYLALANLPLPPNVQLDQNGNSIADSWPPNMDVIEKLMACFGQTYRVAYSNCRS